MTRPEWEGSAYPLLRHLTPPVVAITTSADGERNGLIVNSAQRASLVPALPRVSLYLSKINHSHDLAYRSGALTVHLLRQDQWELIWRLGLQSGRDGDKLQGLDVRTGETGCPYIGDCIAAFEGRVVNAMDAGAATFFLVDIVAVHRGTDGPVMTSEHFRRHMPDDKKVIYEARLLAAQDELARLSLSVSRKAWPGPTRSP